jgi:transcriptional regulator
MATKQVDKDSGPLSCENYGVYVPPKFSVEENAAWRIVEDAGAGMLVIATTQGLQSVFVPVIVSEDRHTITSHLARANSWWRLVGADTEVLALFLAASTYVSPSLYPSRMVNPDVVPTWNYVAAEVRGRVTLHDEPEWKLEQVDNLTRHFEAGREPEWRLEETSQRYRDQQLKGIVGIEIEVTSIQGKEKLSQNRPSEDRVHVRDTLAAGTILEQNVAKKME